MQSRNELVHLDLLRPIAILCVVALHAVTPYMQSYYYDNFKTWFFILFVNGIGRAGVPIFFMISGYLYLSNERTLDCKNFYKRVYPRILLPLFVWSFFYFIYNRVVFKQEIQIGLFFEAMINQGTEYHFWYLYVLGVILFFMPFLKRIVNMSSDRELVWFFILIIFAGTFRPLFNIYTPYYLYISDYMMNGYMGFFVLGYLLQRMELTRRRLYLAILSTFAGLFIHIFGTHFLSSKEGLNLFYNSGYNIAVYLMGSGIFVWVKYICQGIQKEKTIKNIQFIARGVFGVYLIHVAIQTQLQAVFYIDASPIITTMYVFLGSMMISSVLVLIGRSIPYLRYLL